MRRIAVALVMVFASLVLLSADSFARGGRGGGGRGGGGRGGAGRGGAGRTGGTGRTGRNRGNRGRTGNQRSAKDLAELQKAEDRLAHIKERRQALIDAARAALMESRSRDERVDAVDRLADPK